jgi:hypothetical protein
MHDGRGVPCYPVIALYAALPGYYIIQGIMLGGIKGCRTRI